MSEGVVDVQPQQPVASEEVIAEGSPPVLEEVYLSQEMFTKFINLKKRVHPHVKVDGLRRYKSVVVDREVRKMEACSSIQELVGTIEEARERWIKTDLFQHVGYNFEPVQGGAATDILVRLELDEKAAKQEFGVFTTDSAVPELRMKFYNILRRGYSFQMQYIPPSAKTHSWTMQAISYTPWLGDRFEVSVGDNKTQLAWHPAEAEKISEVKATIERSSKKWFESLTAGYQRRELASRDMATFPFGIARDIGVPSVKHYLRHELRYTNTMSHRHPMLYEAYPLPIWGTEAHITSDLSGGPLGGDVSLLAQEARLTKYIPVHPLANISLSGRVGAVWNLGSDRIRLNDRLFLGWRHLRGHLAVGPSTFTDEFSDGDPVAVQRFAATGGNLLWALSASLNMPFLPFPQNMVAMHLFANVGNLAWLPNRQQLVDRWHELFQKPAASIGAGFIVSKLPVFGNVLPSGRLEFNVSLPVTVGADGISFAPENPNLFNRFRFGLIWASSVADNV